MKELSLFIIVLLAALSVNHLVGMKNPSEGERGFEEICGVVRGLTLVEAFYCGISDNSNLVVYRPVQTLVMKALGCNSTAIHYFNLALIASVAVVLHLLLRAVNPWLSLVLVFYFLFSRFTLINGLGYAYFPTMLLLLLGLLMVLLPRSYVMPLFIVSLLTKESGLACGWIAVYRLGWSHIWIYLVVAAYFCIRCFALGENMIYYVSSSSIVGVGMYELRGDFSLPLAEGVDNIMKNVFGAVLPFFYGNGLVQTFTYEYVWILPACALSLYVMDGFEADWFWLAVFLSYSAMHVFTFRERLLCVQHALMCTALAYAWSRRRSNAIPVLCTWIGSVHLVRETINSLFV
jgi:hypothetical protein